MTPATDVSGSTPKRDAEPIFQAGHVPMIGEWVALPVLRAAGATGPTDPLAGEVLYPTAQRLLEHCDAVLRLPGESTGADQDVAIARRRGLPVYHTLAEIPGIAAPAVRSAGALERGEAEVSATGSRR
jgi:hypothetical protein